VSAAGVNEYQTLASVAGAPQVASSWASSASVVASVVSRSSLNPIVVGVAPTNVSLPGGAAPAASACTTASSGRTSRAIAILVRLIIIRLRHAGSGPASIAPVEPRAASHVSSGHPVVGMLTCRTSEM
jgi:hypothetical protein